MYGARAVGQEYADYGGGILTDTARVISVKDNIAKVAIIEQKSCGGGGCAGCSGCGTSIVDAVNTAGAKVGQQVKVEFKSSVYLKSAALVFGLPLVMFLIGLIGGIFINDKLKLNFPSELFGGAAGTVLCIISYFILRFADRKFKKSGSASYEIVKILN